MTRATQCGKLRQEAFGALHQDSSRKYLGQRQGAVGNRRGRGRLENSTPTLICCNLHGTQPISSPLSKMSRLMGEPPGHKKPPVNAEMHRDRSRLLEDKDTSLPMKVPG